MPRANDRRHAQRGQMTVEFVFAMLFLLVFIAAIMQALMFELDVFNRIGEARLAAFQRAHLNQDETEKGYFNESIQFTSVGDLGVQMKIGAWELTEDLQYGDKNYYMREGTEYYESFLNFRHEDWHFMLSVLATHLETTAEADLIFYDFNPAMQVLYVADDLPEMMEYGLGF